MLVKFEQNRIRMVQMTRNVELFDKNPELFIIIFDKESTPFWKKYIKPSSSQGEWLPPRDFSLLLQNEKKVT